MFAQCTSEMTGGSLVYGYDSPFGCERSRIQFPDVPVFRAHSWCTVYRNLGDDVKFIDAKDALTDVAWPSGLRRWIHASVITLAWIRIPPLPNDILNGVPFSE